MPEKMGIPYRENYEFYSCEPGGLVDNPGWKGCQEEAVWSNLFLRAGLVPRSDVGLGPVVSKGDFLQPSAVGCTGRYSAP